MPPSISAARERVVRSHERGKQADRPDAVVRQRPSLHPQRLSALAVALACVIGAVLVLGATSRGIGLTPDSMQYLAAAQSASEGRGLITYAWDAEPRPLTHFPPAYPLVLTGAARAGWSPDSFARWFNVALFVATILIAAVIVRRLAPDSVWAVPIAAGVFAVAHDLVVAHSMAWSEPMYLTLTLGGCVLLGRAIDRQALHLLALAAVVAGLSATVRYVGVANIGVLALTVALWWRGSWWRRLGVAGAVSIVAAFPLLVALTVGGAGGGGDAESEALLANRTLGWYPIGAADLRLLASVIGKWVSPLSDATYLTAVWLVGLAILLSIVVASRARGKRSRTDRTSQRTALGRILALYVAVYLTVLTLSMSFADAQTAFDSRLLAPTLTVAIVLGVAWLVAPVPSDRGVSFAMCAIVALIAAAELSRLVPWAREARKHGLGLRRIDSSERPVVAATSRLPESAHLYSNRPYFLRAQTSRIVSGVPRERDPNSLLPNPRYAEQVRAMCARAATRATYIVLFAAHESEDPTANGHAAASNGDETWLPGGRLIKVRPGCRA